MNMNMNMRGGRASRGVMSPSPESIEGPNKHTGTRPRKAGEENTNDPKKQINERCPQSEAEVRQD